MSVLQWRISVEGGLEAYGPDYHAYSVTRNRSELGGGYWKATVTGYAGPGMVFGREFLRSDDLSACLAKCEEYQAERTGQTPGGR